MTHLRIEQNNGVIEEVSSAVITKLYDLAHDNTLDNTSNLQGRLHSTTGYYSQVQYLTTTYPELYINVDTYGVEFEDSEVERICVANWGSDGIVTTAQLSAIQPSGNFTTFKNNTSIVKFNEFQYFTGVAAKQVNPLESSFLGCSNLEEIVLPSTTWRLNATFKDCSKLKAITIPNTVTTLVNEVFDGCNTISTLTVPASVVGDLDLGTMGNLQELVTTGCCFTSIDLRGTKLTSVTLPNTIRQIILSRHSLLTEITIQSTHPSIYLPRAAFADNTLLRQINGLNLSNITMSGGSNGGYQFSNCVSLQGNWDFSSTSFPNDTVPQMFMNKCSSVQSVTLPSSITAINGSAFHTFNPNGRVIVQSTTPPTLSSNNVFQNGYSSNKFTSGCTIYVPDASLSAYQADSIWSQYGSRVKGMSELPSS